MYEPKFVESHWHFTELERMLSEAIDRGFVREIPVPYRSTSELRYSDSSERWFVECESGAIYSLCAPGERSCGTWQPVPTGDLHSPQTLFSRFTIGRKLPLKLTAVNDIDRPWLHRIDRFRYLEYVPSNYRQLMGGQYDDAYQSSFHILLIRNFAVTCQKDLKTRCFRRSKQIPVL